MAGQQQNRQDTSQWILVKTFAWCIFAGTILLALPISSAEGSWTSPLTAFFTATSAVCVTGLIVVDTGTAFSSFGQTVILGLIQVGGLGIMSISTFLLVLVGRRLNMRNEFVLMDSLGRDSIRGMKHLIARVMLYTFFIELAGAGILAHSLFTCRGFSLSRALYHGLFHSVSAFCNAGFCLYSDSLVGLQRQPVFVLTVACLIFLGGIGFMVLYNLASLRFWRRDRLKRGRLSLHSKVALVVSFVLIVAGTVFFLIFEGFGTLAGLSWSDRIACSVFQSITPRTAGFNVVETGELGAPAFFMTVVLMFIGGSPGSTAGGIKVTTLFVLVITTVSMIRGREETEFRRRAVPAKIVREALAIFMLSIFTVAFFFGILLITEKSVAGGLPLLSGADLLLFETVSAFGTVGLSAGITPDLSAVGKLILIACMFIGRVGPLTIALTIGVREVGQRIRYPQEDLVVG